MTDQHRPANVPAVKDAWKQARKEHLPRRDGSDDLKRISSLVAPILVAVGAAMWVGWKADSVAPVLLWVFASFAAGGMMGFLFGIPKSGLTLKAEPRSNAVTGVPAASAQAATGVLAQADSAQRARPNTNLEEVSDWLTKIIVGLTLVHANDLLEKVGRICFRAAAAIRANPTASDISAATALVVGFALIGFLAVYLYMRLFLQGAMARSDEQMMNRYLDAVDEAERIGAKEASPDDSAPVPVVPSAASLTAAQAVADVAPSDPELILQPLRQLACEYEALRLQSDYSNERTRQMADIVRRMRPHAIAAVPYVGELMRSTSTGEHLAATVILQMKYMSEHMEWLARRLVEERAFIGYQAASALLARVRVAGLPECKALQAAVQTAKADRVRLGIAEPSLDRLIDQIVAAQ